MCAREGQGAWLGEEATPRQSSWWVWLQWAQVSPRNWELAEASLQG